MKPGLKNQLKGYITQIVKKNPGKYTFDELVSEVVTYSKSFGRKGIKQKGASKLVTSLLDTEIELCFGEIRNENIELIEEDRESMRAYPMKTAS